MQLQWSPATVVSNVICLIPAVCHYFNNLPTVLLLSTAILGFHDLIGILLKTVSVNYTILFEYTHVQNKISDNAKYLALLNFL